MKAVTPFLTFQDRAEEAITFYVSLFKNSRITSLVRSGGDGPMPEGAVLHATFELDGQPFMAMEAGPHFKFSEGFSIFVDCKTQGEVDTLWEKLSQGGEKQQCGWLRDRYGVSWQIIPSVLMELMTDPDPEKSKRVMDAMLKMTKIDIEGLRRAHRGT